MSSTASSENVDIPTSTSRDSQTNLADDHRKDDAQHVQLEVVQEEKEEEPPPLARPQLVERRIRRQKPIKSYSAAATGNK